MNTNSTVFATHMMVTYRRNVYYYYNLQLHKLKDGDDVEQTVKETEGEDGLDNGDNIVEDETDIMNENNNVERNERKAVRLCDHATIIMWDIEIRNTVQVTKDFIEVAGETLVWLQVMTVDF